jgi:dUTP pyrophosphatase
MRTEQPKLYIKRLVETAKIPTRASLGSAGCDLYANEKKTILPLKNDLVATGISMKIPDGYYGRIAPRSGFSVKTGLLINAGVIDSDYRGEVKILFQNTKDYPIHIQVGERVAQLVLEKILLADIEEVADLDKTERGFNGFGSSGSY